MKEQIEKAIRQLQNNVAVMTEQAEGIIADISAGRQLSHAAHRLASDAQELAVLAGKIEALQQMLRSL